ncbi:LEA type 2 family protein [Haloarchaeobius sp. FL176]|uniref:LEA type 2 family protein n=1 Tax=Haloarchaeobius sp. FL176 TaxID=2967129 RepID=UPI002147D009|nr:LEA type 2 family protein [Haloarchaeobius sp. FL176]
MTDGTDTGEGSTGGGFAAVKGVLFGSKLRIGAVLVAGLAGVVVAASLLGFLGVPSVTGVENRFGETNESTTVIETELGVQNPNPVGTGFLGVSAEYEVAMNNITMASGQRSGIDVGPGQSTVTTRSYLQNEKIPRWWASHIRRGEQTDVRIDASIRSGLVGRSFAVPQQRTIDTDLLSSFNSTETREVNADRPLVDDPVLYVNRTAGQWGDVTNESTPIVLDFYVYNPKPYAIPISQIEYAVNMNNITVGEGTNTREYVLEPGEVTQVRTVTTIENANLDEWWVSHLQRDQVTDLRIDFSVTTEISGTSIQIPMDRFTYAETIETDIFGTKDATDAAGGNGTDGSEPDDGTTGSSDGTTTGDGSGGTATDGDSGDDGTTSGGGTTTDGDGILGVRATDVARIA